MGRWQYTLKFGKALRNAIDEEDYSKILDCLVGCFSEINKALPDIYDTNELDCDLDDIFVIKDNYEDGEDVEDSINYKLEDLFDLCDNLGVWVGGI